LKPILPTLLQAGDLLLTLKMSKLLEVTTLQLPLPLLQLVMLPLTNMALSLN